jgi:hypothetical protein
MHGIYVTAGLTILVTAVLGITALNHVTKSDHRYYWLVIAGLPLSFIANKWIKIPFLMGLGNVTGIPLQLGAGMPVWFIIVIWLTAPVVEEAVKVLPMGLGPSHGFLWEASSALWAGLALGIGFGLGEAAYLAYGLAQSPDFNQLPWYLFTGYAIERLIVTFGHGFLTSNPTLGMHFGWRKFLLGYLLAVGLHALVNLGPMLLALNLMPASIAGTGSYLVILGAFLIYQKNSRNAGRKGGKTTEDVVYFDRSGGF